MENYTITVLPGDGVGPEVTRQALKVLRAVADDYGYNFTIYERLVGAAAIDVEGAAISATTLELCEQSDAILFGAVGGLPAPTGTKAKIRPEEALYRLRKGFHFFSNLRPVKPFKQLLNASTIKPEVLQGTDLMVVRELSAGLYYGYIESTPAKPSEIRQTADGEEAIDTLLYTDAEIERIVRVAFTSARERRKKVTSVDKANVLSSSILWRRIVQRVAAEYPDVTFEHMLVDSCAMNLIRRPTDFDVIVTENLFGDILTDEASMLAGSMGMLPSASLGTRRTKHGLFGLYEPIHGSAPDIAGQNKANPIAAILSVAMLLHYSLGMTEAAIAIETAVEQTLAAGYRTADIYEPGTKMLGTQEMGQQIVDALTRVYA